MDEEITTTTESELSNLTTTTSIVEELTTELEAIKNISTWNKSQDVINSKADDQVAFTADTYLYLFYTLIIIINLLFIYVILKNNLHRSPFYLTLLHTTIFSTVYVICGVLAPSSFTIPDYGYHIFTNSKNVVLCFETVLFTAFIFDWFVKSEEYCRHIILVFWIISISYIFLGCIAVSCGDRLFYSFYILPLIMFTVLLITFSAVSLLDFKKIRRDEKYKIRIILVLAFILCFLPDYLLLLIDVSMYYYYLIDIICPALMYGHGLIIIIFALLLDHYLRLHVVSTFKSTQTYQQNTHFPVENV